MPTSIIILLAVVALPVLIKYFALWIVVPLVVWKKQSVEIRPTRQMTEHSMLTPEMQDLLGATIRGFVAEGFKVVANNLMNKPVTGVEVVQVLLVNSTGDVGQIFGTNAKHNRALVFGVGTIFENGCRVLTLCSPKAPTIMPPRKDVDSVTLGNFVEVAPLYEFHSRRLQKRRLAERRRVAPEPGKEGRYLDEEWNHELKHMSDCGYYRRNEKKGVYKFTLRGAFCSTWKMLEPLKSRRMKRRHELAMREWRELRMDEWIEEKGSLELAEPIETADALATPDQSASSILDYDLALADGEARVQELLDGVSLRLGNPTRRQELIRNWPTIAWLAFMLWMFYMVISRWWHMRMFLTGLPPAVAARFRPTMYPSAYRLIPFLLIIPVALRLFRNLRYVRGTTTLTATSKGLAFRNARGAMGDGLVDRADIRSIVVLPVAIRLTGKTFKIQLNTERKKIVLYIGRNKKKMLGIRDQLAIGMGIEKAMVQA